jgi:hypothetical protein
MNEIKIVDNFCDKELFEKLLSVNEGNIPWRFGIVQSYDDEFIDQICDKNYNHQYIHTVY